jgi:MFS family permease
MNPEWIALTNTTLAVLMAGINTSILLIALPAIFRGLGIDPLGAGNTSLLLWVLLGYSVVTTTLLVTVGRVSDIFGRVRLYTVGFAVFTGASVLLTATWSTSTAGALEIIGFRVIQGIGAASLFANSAAILTDVFPAYRRGLALGTNQLALVTGSVIGLILGGVLAVISWRIVFAVSIPFGIAGTIWAWFRLQETARPSSQQGLDPLGNAAFGIGLTVLLVALTYGILPYGHALTGWRNPWVISGLAVGSLLLVLFVYIETRVPQPMFRLDLFRIRAFAAGNIAGWLAGIARGGVQFLLIIWLQGVWLPLHGYPFATTPLWAGIYMLPMMIGYLMGPFSGYLSDRYGARTFATLGIVLTTVGFCMLAQLDANFVYWRFAGSIFLLGIGMGLFSSPNTSSIMSSVPEAERGVASGMRATLQNSGMVLSMILFFTVIILVLADSLPPALARGLTEAGLTHAAAARIAALPPTAAIFAAFLGYNPMQHILPPEILAGLEPTLKAHLLAHNFFPRLIGPPLMHGLRLAFYIAAGMSLVAAVASMFRGRQIYTAPAARLPSRERRASGTMTKHPPAGQTAVGAEQHTMRRVSRS